MDEMPIHSPRAVEPPDAGVDAPPAEASSPRRPLRVALFTDNYGPSPSGVLYAVQFLERQLLDQGFEVQVVAPACSGPNPYRGHPGRTEVRLPSMKLPGLPMSVANGRRFERALDDFAADPPDVIHVQGLDTVGMLGVWAADRTERPLMVTWHTDFAAYADYYAAMTPFLDAYYRLVKLTTHGMKRPSLRDMQRWIKIRPLKRGMLRRSLINAARDMLEASEIVTTPSEKTAARVRELTSEAHLRVVPNGADALPEGPPLPKGTGPRIVYVGRIAPEKNIGLLLEAFGWVREDIPDAELMIVGDWRRSGTLRPTLQRARGRAGVTLVGEVPRDRLGPYYASGDVFAFPSDTDTQALVLHEAAHAGLPIVTVDPELRLVVDNGVNGLVTRPTAEAFARGIVTMLRRLEDPEFKAAAQARSREMASWWSIENQSRAIVELYRALAEGEQIEESLTAIPPTIRTDDA